MLYLELVMLLNFGVDLLLLCGTNQLAGHPSDFRRILPAAALGAVYSGGCLYSGFPFLGALPWRFASLLLMSVIAFGTDMSAWKRCGLFSLMCMSVGGAAVSAGKGSLLPMLLAVGGVWVLSCLAFGQGGERYVSVSILTDTSTLTIRALRDTGNTLCDPITGESVLVIGPDAAGELTGLTREELRDPLQTMSGKAVSGLRLIPYHSVGNPGGLMLAKRFPKVQVGSTVRSRLVGFAPYGLEDDIQALTGGF